MAWLEIQPSPPWATSGGASSRAVSLALRVGRRLEGQDERHRQRGRPPGDLCTVVASREHLARHKLSRLFTVLLAYRGVHLGLAGLIYFLARWFTGCCPCHLRQAKSPLPLSAVAMPASRDAAAPRGLGLRKRAQGPAGEERCKLRAVFATGGVEVPTTKLVHAASRLLVIQSTP
jgi:hypothetical protein